MRKIGVIVLYYMVGIFVPFLGECIYHFSIYEDLSKERFFQLLFKAVVFSLIVCSGILYFQKRN